ncbi:hypothetical protein NYE39_02260 [Janibacter sp. FSL W8-0316]|uniref:hypothetical protein n=1 Tax=Janibacter sp. FSL W8-0316 TaxID=2975325 RepID=UPI0030FA9719
MAKQNQDLINETAAVLLEAIKEAAPDAHRHSSEGLESLARAYSLVVEQSLNEPPVPRSARRVH